MFHCLLVIITWLIHMHKRVNLSTLVSFIAAGLSGVPAALAELENSLGICTSSCLLDVATWKAHRCLSLMFVNLSPASRLSSWNPLFISELLSLEPCFRPISYFAWALWAPCQYLLSRAHLPCCHLSHLTQQQISSHLLFKDLSQLLHCVLSPRLPGVAPVGPWPFALALPCTLCSALLLLFL